MDSGEDILRRKSSQWIEQGKKIQAHLRVDGLQLCTELLAIKGSEKDSTTSRMPEKSFGIAGLHGYHKFKPVTPIQLDVHRTGGIRARCKEGRHMRLSLLPRWPGDRGPGLPGSWELPGR
jgi:hypothetical protein